MKKSNLVIILMTCLSFLLFFGFASAHEDEIDGSITATMHIEPADSPAAHATSTLEFIFQDTTGRFNLMDCKCELNVIYGTSTIYISELRELSMLFIFPQKGLYTIELRGEPLINDQFSHFDLKFDIDVNRDAGEEISIWDRIKNSHFFHEGHWLHLLIFGGGIIMAIYVIITDKEENNV